MENIEYVAAVDLGTTKVVIAVARRADKNKVEIIALKELNSQGVIKGDVRNGEMASRVLKEVKAKIEAELNISIQEVYIGISGQHIKCSKATGYVFVQNSDREVSEVSEYDVKRLRDDMKNSVIPIGQTIIAVLPQSYTLDDETDITEPVGMEGRRLEARFNLIIGEDAAIERIRRTFNRVGFNVAGIILQPLASSEAVLSEDEKELGVAVVDIGGGTTDLCIFYDKIIRHIAVTPIGGNIINKDIKAYGILERHVEKLKVNFGEAIAEKAQNEKYINIPSVSGQAPKEIAVKALAGIIEARMEDIIDFVASEIDRCGLKGKLGAGLVLTGGGATLKNLDQLFRAKFGCEVRVALPTIHLTPESAEKIANPKYSTIAGLLIDAIRTGKYTDIVVLEEPQAPIVRPTQPIQSGNRNNQYLAPEHTQITAPQQINTQTQPDEEYYTENDETQTDKQYEELPYDEEEITTTTKGKSIFDKFRNMFSKMFVEDVDDDENYYK